MKIARRMHANHIFYREWIGYKIRVKTRYEEFYPYFLEKANPNNLIKNWINENKILWSDLELLLGTKMEELKGEEELALFYTAKEELKRSFQALSESLPEVEKGQIKNLYRNYSNEEYIYQFIIFNYTDIVDRFVELFKGVTKDMISEKGVTIKENEENLFTPLVVTPLLF